MTTQVKEQSEDITILEQITLSLQGRISGVELQHTGGGIYCIYVPLDGKGWTWWGVADAVWGCDIYDGDNYVDSHSLDGVPVSLDNITQAADAIISFANSFRAT